MMMMDSASVLSDAFNSFNPFSFNSSTDPDVDWSVFENADRYLLRDDSVWITRLSKDFWWNLERISELSVADVHRFQRCDSNLSMNNRFQSVTKQFPQQQASPMSMSMNSSSTRKVVGQRSTTHRPAAANIPEKSNFFQNFSSIADRDTEYNPFQSKISFDNHLWSNATQQAAIP